MDFLDEYWDSLSADLAAGTISPPIPIDKDLSAKLRRKLSPTPQRAEEINEYGPKKPQELWPELDLISCWLDGPSNRHAKDLQEKYFPRINMQGKGLIATEAFVSFPLVGMQGSVLSGTSHFFEFIPLTQSGKPIENTIRLAHQLKTGESYSVVVTTGGGLYRYQLQDTVEVVGHYKEMPRIRFTGKLDGISDIFGEKLSEQFVAGELYQLFEQHALKPSFFLLCPNMDMKHYVLYLEDSTVNEAVISSLDVKLDQRLCKNFHYDYCRKLGQLNTVRIFHTGPGATHKFFAHCASKGMRQGDIKARVLSKTPLDHSVFL